MSHFLLVYSTLIVSVSNTKKKIVNNIKPNFSLLKITKTCNVFLTNPELTQIFFFLNVNSWKLHFHKQKKSHRSHKSQENTRGTFLSILYLSPFWKKFLIILFFSSSFLTLPRHTFGLLITYFPLHLLLTLASYSIVYILPQKISTFPGLFHFLASVSFSHICDFIWPYSFLYIVWKNRKWGRKEKQHKSNMNFTSVNKLTMVWFRFYLSFMIKQWSCEIK